MDNEKETQLGEIQTYIQDVLQVIANVIDLQISVVDSAFIEICGSGLMETFSGKATPKGGIMYKTIVSGKSYFIQEPRTSNHCKGCVNIPICRETASVSFPVRLGNEIIGAVGLNCLTEEERCILLSKKAYFTNFLEKLADLLATKVKENLYFSQIQRQNGSLMEILNCIDDSILILSERFHIVNHNKNALSMLKTEEDQLLGKHVSEIIRGLDPNKLAQMHEGLLYEEVYVEQAKKEFAFLINPTTTAEGQKGYTIVIKELEQVSRIASAGMRKKPSNFHQIIGRASAFVSVKTLAEEIAQKDVDILVLGESGCGKEPFARAIHSSSRRKGGPFIAINCGAIPKDLLESELFGYEKGAFTGAYHQGKAGKFELANNGTLFLDEIGDMPLALQVKLLRALEERTIERIGGSDPVFLNIRVISATNKDLPGLIRKGLFREDLYYRLNVFPIRIPPLRERSEDIPLLCRFFIEKYNQIFDTTVEGFSAESMKILKAHSWPGNIRELENCIQYLCCTVKKGTIDEGAVLYCPVINPAEQRKRPEIANASDAEPADPSSITPLAELEYREIRRALQLFGSSTEGKTKAAEALGIGRTTLYRKLQEMKADNRTFTD